MALIIAAMLAKRSKKMTFFFIGQLSLTIAFFLRWRFTLCGFNKL